MTDSLFFVGHVSIDRVQNINGVKTQPGGAALYAAVAAKTLYDNVRIISVIGKDYKFMNILRPFGLKYLKIFNMPSTKFEIIYNERWEAKYAKTSFGAGSRISDSMIPSAVYSPNSALHISPIHPKKAEKIIQKVKNKSPETIISINTWIGYIKEGRKNKEILKRLALQSDFFILNDSEAKALAGTQSLSTALKLLKARTLIVTLGEIGAIISRENGEIHMIPALNFPINKVIDTTGAGDTWCGAFLAAYKTSGEIVKAVTAASIISGIKCSGWGFDKLLNLRFKSVDGLIEYVIGLREGSLQKRLTDYLA